MKAYYPKNVFFYTVDADRYGNIHINSYYEKSTMWKNKLVAVGKKNEDVKQIISRTCTPWIRSCDEPVVYVSSDCKMSRDVLRNSGYKITYKKDVCGTIVIPAIINSDIYHVKFNMCFVSHNDNDDVFLSLYTVTGFNNIDGEPVFPNQVSSVIETVKKHKENQGFVVDELITSGDTSLFPLDVFTIPKCDEYKEIINGENDKFEGRYVYDTDVKLTAPIDINLDTLAIWKNVDTNILAKAIPSSNWQDYPMTLALFLYTEKQTIRYIANGNLRTILNEIGFTNLYDKDTTNKLVQPEDWKMWTDYVMSKYGVPSTGGFSKKVGQSTLPGARIRVAVAPFVITEPMTYDNIISTIKSE